MFVLVIIDPLQSPVRYTAGSSLAYGTQAAPKGKPILQFLLSRWFHAFGTEPPDEGDDPAKEHAGYGHLNNEPRAALLHQIHQAVDAKGEQQIRQQAADQGAEA